MILQLGIAIPLFVSAVSTALQVSRNAVRFPALRPGFGVAELLALRRRGLEGRIGFDPVTGDLVVSSTDQPPSLVQRLALEAFQRRTFNEVTNELLAEDPLFFIRQLPRGDPRRVAAGLDGGPHIAPGGVGVSIMRSAPLSTTTPKVRVRPRAIPSFRRRASFGRFARVQIA